MKEIKYTILYCGNFCDSILLGSGTGINYGSGSAKFRNKLWFRFR